MEGGEPNSTLPQPREEETRTHAELLRELNRVRSELQRRKARDEALRSSRGGEAGPRQSSRRTRQQNRESKYINPDTDIN